MSLQKKSIASFFLFYGTLLRLSLPIAVVVNFIIPSLYMQTPGGELRQYCIQAIIGFPTFTYLGALGLTHLSQRKQYGFYQNQGWSIGKLSFFSWLIHLSLGIVLYLIIRIGGMLV